jgi:hypothetical protein
MREKFALTQINVRNRPSRHNEHPLGYGEVTG